MGNSQVIDARWAFAGGGLVHRRANTGADTARRMPIEASPRNDRARLSSLIERMAERDESALTAFYDETLSKA
jgi:hypothetical protein